METLIEGKPYLWKSPRYGDVAVHFTRLSPNGLVANFTIDGGEASKQAQQFPEMSDGIYFAVIGQLVKRPARRRTKASAERTLAEKAGVVKPPPRKRLSRTELFEESMPIGSTVRNTIRSVPGIGPVGVVTEETF